MIWYRKNNNTEMSPQPLRIERGDQPCLQVSSSACDAIGACCAVPCLIAGPCAHLCAGAMSYTSYPPPAKSNRGGLLGRWYRAGNLLPERGIAPAAHCDTAGVLELPIRGAEGRIRSSRRGRRTGQRVRGVLFRAARACLRAKVSHPPASNPTCFPSASMQTCAAASRASARPMS